MAAVAYPSWAYNATAPAQIVANAAAFNALGPGWQFSPFPQASVNVPVDPGLTDTDTRLQQILAELRVANLLLQAGFSITDNVDATGLRTDILASDIGLAT